MIYVHDVRWKVSALCRDFVADARVTHMAPSGVLQLSRPPPLRRLAQAMDLPVLLVLTKDDRLVAEDNVALHQTRVQKARWVAAHCAPQHRLQPCRSNTVRHATC